VVPVWGLEEGQPCQDVAKGKASVMDVEYRNSFFLLNFYNEKIHAFYESLVEFHCKVDKSPL